MDLAGSLSIALHDLGKLNALLAQDTAFDQLDVNENGAFVRARRRDWKRPEQLLQVIADCLCQVDFTLVRRCENPECTLLFHDMTKSHRRRWCSMAVSGNRAKAAAHRARSKQ